MSNFVFLVNWIAPNGATTDITDRCILDRCGSINRGVAAADDLFAFTSGDLTLEFNNQDGFFTSFMQSDPVDLSKLNDIRSLVQVDLKRDGNRHFRGFLLPQAIKMNRLEKTIAVTVLGPMRLLDAVSAERLARVFPANLIVQPPGAAINATAITINQNVPLLIGDSIGIGIDDTIEAVVLGYDSSSLIVTLTEALPRAVAAGELVTCLTPYPRDQDMFDLAGQLFGLGGITPPNRNIQFTGLVGSRPFFTSFNTNGTNAVGELRALKQAQGALPTQHSLVANLESPSATTTTEVAATTPFSGFFPVAGSPVVLTLDGVNVESGGWKNFADQGGLAGEPVEGLLTANVFRKPMDSVKVLASGGPGLFATTRLSYDVVQTLGGQTYLYQLSMTQSVQSIIYPNSSPFPDYEFGGRDYLVKLTRYVTANGGLAWTKDTAFVPSFPAPVIVASPPPGSKTYSYKIVAFGAGGQPIASSDLATTTTGPNLPLSAARNVVTTWTSVVGATLYGVYRVVVGNGETTGRIATVAALTYNDTGAAVGDFTIANPKNELWIQNAIGFTGSGLATRDWVLSAHPFLTGTGYDHVLYFSGLFGDASVVSNFRNLRLRVNGGAPDVLTALHFGAAGCKALFTRPYSSYSAGTRHVDFYYWDLSSSAPAIVHTQDDGITHTAGTGAIYNTGLNPIIRSFRWNQVDGVGARIFGLYSNKTAGSGTGYLIMTPGNQSFAPTFESLFATEFQGVIDPQYTLVFNAVSGGTRSYQVCTNLDSISGGFGNQQRTDSAHLAAWTVIIGGSGSQKILVGYAANKWFIASRFHTGFLSYANFAGMSASKALQELAFVVNCFVNVDWTSGGSPFGTFLSRDLPAPVTPKLLANLNGSKPAGQFQDVILAVDYDRSWTQAAPYVEVKGVTDDTLGTAGVADGKQQGMSVAATFVETSDLAQAIAETLFTYYGPGWPVSQSPLVTPTGIIGTSVYRYVVVATLGTDPRVNIKAISALGGTTSGNLTLSVGNPNAITFAGIAGASHYHVYRVYSTGLGTGATLGLIVTTNSNNFTDSGATGATPTLPSSLKQPRQGATLEVIDDLFLYLARGEVQFFDLLGHTDLGEPTGSPVIPPDLSKPPRWWIENIDYNPTEPTIHLQVVEKDVS